MSYSVFMIPSLSVWKFASMVIPTQYRAGGTAYPDATLLCPRRS